MPNFYAPYNFVPMTGVVQRKGADGVIRGKSTAQVEAADIAKGTSNLPVRHDLWMPNSRSGVLVCQLCTNSPMVVGAEQTGGSPTDVIGYTVGGKPAIPGTSIRGAISAIAEAISQSALRVLDDQSLSFSAGKQQRVTVPGTIHDAFKRQFPDSLPWNSQRSRLTPAELLFGVVADGGHTSLPGLRSRMSIEDALPFPGASIQFQTAATLQILSSPKPKAACMYWNDPNSTSPVKKRQLNLANKHLPNGRKFYVPHPMEQRQTAVMETKNTQHMDQKLRVLAIPEDSFFAFELRFESLTDAELGLLLTSLRPSPDFEHRIGMGKPLGMGHCFIDVLAMRLVDRSKRYSLDGWSGSRYQKTWLSDCVKTGGASAQVRELFPVTFAGLQENTAMFIDETNPNGSTVRDFTLIDSATLVRMRKLGELASFEELPVVYPLKTEQFNANGLNQEADLFRWFVANEAAQRPQGMSLPSTDPNHLLPPLNSANGN